MKSNQLETEMNSLWDQCIADMKKHCKSHDLGAMSMNPDGSMTEWKWDHKTQQWNIVDESQAENN